MSQLELPTHRIATTDEQGSRIYLYLADVSGKFRTWRSRFNIFLIFLFLLLPWMNVNQHQAMLLDIPRRRFAVFGVTFLAHDAPMLLFVFGGAAMMLALITAIWGRVWCGWACPQTVFVDGVFRKIERWLEGDAVARRKLDQSPMSLDKLIKKASKWFCFTILALLISHSFLAYFVGTEKLALMIRSSPTDNPINFILMVGVTAIILFDFGWFREQFCTIVCPYGRFQSVLMDEDSQVVAYDLKRGEPRKGTNLPQDKAGDCVNCYRCVQVCPTGIDIRRGVQLECIACTACMDACDEVMRRLKKPKGLIRYGALSMTHGKNEKRNTLINRGRVLIYGLIVSFLGMGLIYTLIHRNPVEANLIRAVDAPYQEIKTADGQAEIINHFKVELRNQTFDTKKVSFETPLELSHKGVSLVTPQQFSILEAGQSVRSDFFVRFPKKLLSSGHASAVVNIRIDGEKILSKEVLLVGPLL